MTEHQHYIENQYKLMLENPKLYQERGMATLSKNPLFEYGFGGRVHNSELIPFPKPMLREEEYCKKVKNACVFLYLIPSILAGAFCAYNMRLMQTLNWTQVFCVTFLILSLLYLSRSIRLKRGLFYPISLWENAIGLQKISFRCECKMFFDDLAIETNKTCHSQ